MQTYATPAVPVRRAPSHLRSGLAPLVSPAVPLTQASDDAVSEEILFHRNPIRIVVANGTLWFAAPDLVDALGWAPWTLETAKTSPAIPSYCRSTGIELEDPEIEGEPDGAVTLLSPIGVWLWTEATDALRAQHLTSWTKRQMLELVPTVRRDDPASFLALMPSGLLPPHPTKRSGRHREWIDLKEAHPYLRWERIDRSH